VQRLVVGVVVVHTPVGPGRAYRHWPVWPELPLTADAHNTVVVVVVVVVVIPVAAAVATYTDVAVAAVVAGSVGDDVGEQRAGVEANIAIEAAAVTVSVLDFEERLEDDDVVTVVGGGGGGGGGVGGGGGGGGG
jgi:uncharacterized membrane protein YgcG